MINERVHLIEQEHLGWPFDTLLRYHMFYDILSEIETFHFVFFLNANTKFMEEVIEDILPEDEGLVAVKHPGFYNKSREQFTYETDSRSLAYISSEQGENYYMGAFNGGKSWNYIKLIETLSVNIEKT